MGTVHTVYLDFTIFTSIHLCDYIILNISVKYRAPCNHKHNQDIELLHQYKTLATYLQVSISIYLSINHLCIYCYLQFLWLLCFRKYCLYSNKGEKVVLSKIVENKFKQKKSGTANINNMFSIVFLFMDEILE